LGESSLLETVGLTRSFGGLRAVDGVDFTLSPGEIRVVIGPNGAGKTTFLHLVSGFLAPSRGRILFEGQPITHLSVADRVHRGIARSFQVTNLFPNLTVADNVRVAAQATRGLVPFWRTPASHRTVTSRTRTVLDLVGLTPVEGLYPPQLSHGDQRHLEIALALAPGSRLLLLDEPTAGMSLGETEKTVALIRRINHQAGVSVILVEHDMNVVMRLAHTITVLHYGRTLAEGPPRQIASDPEVQVAYLGRRRHALST
jgi:branched-chain amino acid transport system ATP-binding protein